MAEPALDELQRWMLDVIVSPEGPAGAPGADAIDARVRPSDSLTSSERIGIYAGMYFERLIGVLLEDFPAVAARLGADGFRATCVDYLVAHPSRHYSLNALGAGFAAFLQGTENGAGFTAELADLERGIQEVFDGPPSETLTAEDLANVPPEGWGELALPPVPASRLFRFEHRVNDAYLAWREDGVVPEAVAEVTYLVLVRRDYKVWRFDLSVEEHVLLEGLWEGAPLSVALERAAAQPEVDAGRLAAGIQEWFQRWSGLGFFQAL